MYFFYIFPLIFILTGLFLWYKNTKVTLIEWGCGTGTAFLLAFIFHMVALGTIHSKTSDIETWSGKISYAKHFSRWKEYYEYAVYRTEYYNTTETYYTTDSKGRRSSHTRTVRKSRRVFDHWEPTSRWHEEYRQAYSTLNTTHDIDKTFFEYLVTKFDNRTTVKGTRRTGEHNSKMIDGDPNDYESHNQTQWIEPVTKTVSFQNKIKATPNLFQFIHPPTNINVFNYPVNNDWNKSDRLLGTAALLINQLKFDQLNAELGPLKRVNVIMAGFGDKDPIYGQYQQAKFIGGKKNDLVICFGGGSHQTPAKWAFVFGWTEKDIVKRNIETILLTQPINTDILNLIKAEIKKNYVIKDWKKFDYIKISPPDWVYSLYIILAILIQVGLYIWFNFNEFEKNHWNR